MVTTDTYRVGAVDQLAHFTNLIGVPLDVAPDGPAFERALAARKGSDLILVDTAGRNPDDRAQIQWLSGFFSTHHAVQVHLVIAAATRQLELRNILRRYLALEPSRLVFTKMDEAAALGALLNARVRSELPISHVTFGQRVPEDIALADPARLAQELVRKAQQVNGSGMAVSSIGLSPPLSHSIPEAATCA